MKLGFLGSADFAVPALGALVAAGHDVIAVYTRAPKPAGRGQQERRTPVHERALALGLPVRTPQNLKSEDEAQAFRALDLDAAVVVAYGHILPKSFLDAPVLGCINIHGSLLPRWRGAAPIHRAILAGDAETGVTTMRMDEGLDTGPMLLAERTPISAADTAETVHDRLAELGARPGRRNRRMPSCAALPCRPARCWRRRPSFRCRPEGAWRATSSPSNMTARRSSAGSARTMARRCRSLSRRRC